MQTNARKFIGFLPAFFLILTGFTATSVHAALNPVTFNSDLDALITQGNDLVATTNGITLGASTMDSDLTQLEASVADYRAQVQATYDQLVAANTAPFSIDSAMLTSLQTLSAVQAQLAQGVLDLSGQVITLGPVTSTATLESSFSTMLRLSDDIGVMADRILEMANNILIMADNIGIMADRILETQLIQSANLQTVVNAMLITQQNTITLIGMFL